MKRFIEQFKCVFSRKARHRRRRMRLAVVECDPLLEVGIVDFKQVARLVGPGKIHIDDDVCIGWKQSPGFHTSEMYMEARCIESFITIKNGCVFNNGCSIVSTCGVTIGERCLFGVGCSVVDSDFHGITIQSRNNPEKVQDSPVVVGNDCWFGDHVKVLKGVVLGSGCVVGAGAVVTKSFPANSLIAGVPARFIKTINQEM